MPCTAISEGPCSAGRKANPSRHQPGILCHPCQQGCRETEYPQARSLLPPRTGSKAASAAGSAGGSNGTGRVGTAKPTGATKTPGPFSAVREFGILGHRACGSPCNARILPQKAPEKDCGDGTGCTAFVLCTLPPHPCQRTASHGLSVRVEDSAAAKGGAQDLGSCGVLCERKVRPISSNAPCEDPHRSGRYRQGRTSAPAEAAIRPRGMAFCAHPVYKEKTL